MHSMRKKLNQVLLLFCLIIISVVGANIVGVNADESSYTLTKGGLVWYNSSNYIVKHYFGQIPAYCLQWRLSTIDGSKYTEYNSSSMTERNKFIAGYAIKLVEDDYPDNEDLRHLYATEAVNCLFKINGSVCYAKGNEYVTKAVEYVDKIEKLCEGTNTSGCLNNEEFKLSKSSSNLSQIGTSSNFISKKVTLSGLLKSYGGDEFGVTYKITATSSSSNKVEICSDASGTKCSGATVTLNNKEGDYSFYVKVSNAVAGSNVKIKVTASNGATYPYGVAYKYTDNYQILMIKKEKQVSRGLSRTATFNVPDTAKYTITARKVDENGEDLTGASFSVYRVDKDVVDYSKVDDKWNLLKSNQNGAATLNYLEEHFTTDNEWFNYQYCLRETSAPSGYIYNKDSELKNPLCVKVDNKNRTSCYVDYDLEDSSGYELVDGSEAERCNGHTMACSNGELDGETCKVIETAVSKNVDPVVSCPEGYTMNSGRCEKVIEKEEVETTEDRVYSCVYTYNTDAGSIIVNGEVENEYDDGGNVISRSCNFLTCSNGAQPIDGKCLVNSYPFDKCISDKTVYSGSNEVDTKYCKNDYSSIYVTTDGGNIDFVKTNVRNSVTISKTDITGEKELSGAKMKICTNKPDSNLECNVAVVTKTGQCSSNDINAGICTNNSNDTMNVQTIWVSDIVSKTIRGLDTNKNYYLVETIAPLGYQTSQFTEFSINDDGSVVSKGTVVVDNKILVKNDLNNFLVSKQDLSTSKELPGAEITICYAGKNENGEYQMGVDEKGNCTVPTLANGEDAKWVSTEEPHIVEGLSAGAYYLVESMTPLGYDTAEKILFIVNQDGSITDKDGKSLLDNGKLVMYDRPIVNVPTGEIMIVFVAVLGIAGLLVSIVIKNQMIKRRANEC